MEFLRLSPWLPSKPAAEPDLASKALLATAMHYMEKADTDIVTASAASYRVGPAKGNGVSSGVRPRGAGR